VRERGGDGGEVGRGDELDLVPHRLRLLLGLDEDVRAGRTAFGAL
jgi:hypothetical protein